MPGTAPGEFHIFPYGHALRARPSKRRIDQFEQIYAMCVAERDRLEKELVEALK